MLYVVVTAHNSISGVSNGYHGSHSLQHKFGPSDTGFYDDYLEVRKLTPCGRNLLFLCAVRRGLPSPDTCISHYVIHTSLEQHARTMC